MDVINSLQPPFNMAGAGIGTPFGLWLPPGSRVAAYVYSGSAAVDLIDPNISNNLVTTLNAGLARCRSGKGDYVIVLPGHTESISTANFFSSMVAGTNILCLGEGNNRPTFTWSAAAATWLWNVANVTLDNAILRMEGGGAGSALTVAAPITVSAAGCRISNCRILFGSSATEIVTIGITTTAAATDFTFGGNYCHGVTAAQCTTFMRLTGCDRLRMYNNYIAGATSSTTVGIVQALTTAPVDVDIGNSYFANKIAASVHAFTGMAGMSGLVHDCGFSILNDSLLVGLVTPGNLQGFRNYTVNLAGEQGGATTPVST